MFIERDLGRIFDVKSIDHIFGIISVKIVFPGKLNRRRVFSDIKGRDSSRHCGHIICYIIAVEVGNLWSFVNSLSTLTTDEINLIKLSVSYETCCSS